MIIWIETARFGFNCQDGHSSIDLQKFFCEMAQCLLSAFHVFNAFYASNLFLWLHENLLLPANQEPNIK